jgi:hypothetical protein
VYPSRFASPSLMGNGNGGVCVVSRTRKEAVCGNAWEKGGYRDADECLRSDQWVVCSSIALKTELTSLSLLSVKSKLNFGSAMQSCSGGRHVR